jgi:ABC-type antimicrobial peptide transport system permease subunit
MGMLGLYGVMAYLVALRTREFGLRIAVGAMPARVARSVVQRGLALALVGVVVGLPVFALVATTLRAAVVGVQPWDPLALALAIALLLAIAALATWLPARRAAAIDPARALRAE